MRRNAVLLVLTLLTIPAMSRAQAGRTTGCAPDNAGLKLPPGFCAGLFADTLKQARHLVAAPNGDIILSVAGRGGGVFVLREMDKSGRADVVSRYASSFSSSEVALFDGHLYTEQGPTRGTPGQVTAIVRYPYRPGDLTPSGPPDTIVYGLPATPGHSTRNFVIASDGSMYVNVGSQTNSCQERDRSTKSPGKTPCPELDTRAGIWKFDARKKGQTEQTGVHFAKGIRNAVGITISPLDHRLWTTQHGRDQLGGQGGDWDFSDKYNSENPAEELLQVNQGDDFGWPYCFYSVDLKKLVLAPEYGGDGTKVDQCAQKKEPVAVFPGHWAPNALMFYTGSAFPARYKNGAFIAFHGSWNRTGQPQAGFNVVFQPLSGEKAAGGYEVFADGFAPNLGSGRGGGAGGHRPTGLAQGLDGSLYVADDAGGRIYKIVYTGK